MFLATSLPLSVYAYRTAEGRGRKALAAGGVALVAFGLAMTFSRGSWLAVAAAPVALLVAGRVRLAVGFWGGVLVAAVAIDVASGGALTTRVAGTVGDALVAQRLLLTGAGLLMFQANPLVGVGPGGFGDALEAFGPQISGLFDFVGSAHNGYVHVAAEMGVIGLAAFVYFVVSTLLALGRGARERGVREGEAAPDAAAALRVAFLWSFTTAAIVAFFEWPFAHGVGELLVLVAAIGRVVAHAPGPSSTVSPARPAGP
jgi:O-antigen ligase